MNTNWAKLAFRLGYASGLKKHAQADWVPSQPQNSPMWATARGQENWMRRYRNADEQARKSMLSRLQETSTNMSSEDREKFNTVMGKMQTYAESFNKPQAQQPAQVQQKPRQPNWATSQGQANWMNKFKNSDANTRQTMLDNLRSRSQSLSGDQQRQFNQVASRMSSFANTFKGSTGKLDGNFSSSMDEIRAANTPDKLQTRQAQRQADESARRAANPYINPMNPNGIGPTYNGRLFTRPPVATPSYRRPW